MKKGTAPPPVLKDRSKTQCALVRKETKKAEAAAELPSAINGPEWMERLHDLQHELALPKPPRGPCVGLLQPYVRRQIKKVLPALCYALLLKAIDGDLSTMKLLWQMAELDKATDQASNGANDRKFVRQAIAKYRKR